MKTPFLLLLAATPLVAAPRLHVSSAKIQPDTTIELVLDKEAAPADRVGKVAATPWLQIEPAWAGRTVWKEVNVLSFEPTEAPKLGTTYRFSLIGEHIHLDGTAVPAGKLQAVPTPPFAIEYAGYLNRYDDDWSPRTGAWFVRFNDAAATDAARFFFTDKDGRTIPSRVQRATFGRVKHAGYVKPVWKDRWADRLGVKAMEPDLVDELPLTNSLIVSPASPLPVGKNWTLTADPGTALKFQSRHAIGDIDPLKLSKVYARTVADQPRRIVADFNLKLPKDIRPDAFTVIPSIPGMKIEVRGDELHLLGELTKHDQWTVIFPGTFASADGRVLGGEIKQQVKFKHLKPSIGLPSEDEAQLSSGTRTYRIATVNTTKLHVRVKRLEGPQLIRAMQGYRYYTGRGPDGSSLRPPRPMPYELMDGETIADFEVPLGNPVDTSRDLYLEWDKVLSGDAKPFTIGDPAAPEDAPAAGKPAAVFVEISGTPTPGAPGGKSPASQALIQLTDIGLAWKITDSQALIFAYSCLTGEPLPGVTLETFGEDAQPIGSFTTGADGQARVPRNVTTRHLRASLGDDQFTTEFDNAMPTVGLWRFPVRYSWSETPMSMRRVLLFTDRSLYRPGETVHLKGIVRHQQGNDIRAAKAGTARLTVTNPTGREIVSKDLEVTAEGDLDATFQLPAETTGYHSIAITWAKELESAGKLDNWVERQQAVGNARFTLGLRVEEFRRNAFEIAHELTPPAAGDTKVELGVTASSYNGQPVANSELAVWTSSTATNFYPEHYRDYLFGDYRQPDSNYWFHYFGYRWEGDHGNFDSDSKSERLKLDDAGKATVTAEVPTGDFPMSRQVVIETEVTDSNRQTLVRTTTTTVHPSDVHVGVKRLDRLVRVGDSVPLEVIAVGKDGTPLEADISLTATLTREVNEQVSMRTEDGLTSVRNEARQVDVSQTPLTLAGGQPGEFVFAPTETGLHTLVLRGTDADGHDFATATTIHVYGTDQFPWEYADHMRIKLVSEKKLYQPGDTARVLVLSPIDGTALVTVEREDVSRSFITELKSTDPIIEIPLGHRDAPNCYISVLVIKGAKDSLRKFKEPQLRLGYCELTVENVRDRLSVELATESVTPDPSAPTPVSFLPGKEIRVSGTVKLANGRPAAGAIVTVYAEDEGTLAVTGYETPDPMAHFYDPRELRVQCGTSLGHFIAENPEEQTFYNKGFFIGGGDGEEGGPADTVRRDFNPCALWVAALRTDDAGRFETTAALPDTLTRYRLIAVVHQDASRFGSAESSFTVSKPLMLEPQVPRFAQEGDGLTLRATVTNASDHAGTWRVTITPNPDSSEPTTVLAANTPSHQEIALEAGKSAIVEFPVEFRNTGEAVVSWSAEPVSLKSGELTPALTRRLSDATENPFPVTYPVPLLRQSRLIRINGATSGRDLLASLDPNLLAGRGEIEISASRSLLLEAAGAIDYLLHYPYGCVEQTTSSMLPWLAVDRLRAAAPQLAKHTPDEVRDALQTGVGRLLTMQRGNGGFAYWPDATEVCDWGSSYAGLALILASKQVEVPDSSINALASYLIAQLNKLDPEPKGYDAEMAARSLWVLALAGQPNDGWVNKLLDHPERLSLRARSYLSLAASAAGHQDQARAILEENAAPAIADGWMRWQPDHSLGLLAWTAIDPTSPEATLALDKLMGDRNPYGHWRTTWCNAWALLALATYSETEDTSGTTHLTLEGDPIDPATFALDAANPSASHSVSLSPGLKIHARSDGPAFVRVRLSSKPPIAPLLPVTAHGMEITRFYRRVHDDGSMTPLDIPKTGDLVRIDLELKLAGDDLRYLVVEDRLPAIFEAVNDSFESQSARGNAGGSSQKAWSVSHTEIRGDRAMFFFDRVWRSGTCTLSYLARCTMEGDTMAPPAKVESMYDPDQTALSASRTFSSSPN